MKKSVRLPAFAKINLQLRILGRRPDGYHELRTIFQTISLHDTLTLSISRHAGVRIRTNEKSLPTGPANLVYRAIDAIVRELDFPGGIEAQIVKRIPVSRGLGGGSSDAAAALIGIIRLAGKQPSLPRLCEIAAGLGADVPFFLFGGRALGVNRGDEIYPLADLPSRTLLVISPRRIGVSTKDAYQWISAELTKRPEPPNIWSFCALCWSRPKQLSNDFEGAVFGRHSRLEEIRDGLLEHGATEASLAGSGSAVFGMFRNPAQARRVARNFPEDSVFVAETLSRGKYGRAMGWRVSA